jgi:deazaflavin-dependent oxidoreductase (nitroreductase family)
LLKRLLAAPAVLYRAGGGRLLGHRFLLLAHRGRRSGRRYETVLEVVRWDAERDEATVMSGFGPGAQWYRNVLADGAVDVSIGRRRFSPSVRTLDPDEAAAALAAYERANRLIAPLVRRILSRLAGFRYDGSETSRRRLVETLPLVAFRPRPAENVSRPTQERHSSRA